jgi:hypothetical protein
MKRIIFFTLTCFILGANCSNGQTIDLDSVYFVTVDRYFDQTFSNLPKNPVLDSITIVNDSMHSLSSCCKILAIVFNEYGNQYKLLTKSDTFLIENIDKRIEEITEAFYKQGNPIIFLFGEGTLSSAESLNSGKKNPCHIFYLSEGDMDLYTNYYENIQVTINAKTIDLLKTDPTINKKCRRDIKKD